MSVSVDREADLRAQHKILERERYDGHNRHSGVTTMDDLGKRRTRRRWHMITRRMVQDYNKRAA